jgi:DNA-binding transcriptional ArsR family regulator
MPPRRGPARRYPIRRPAQLRSLRSPVRQEILDALAAAGECSIAELAALLGRRPHSLYHHLRALGRVALVRRSGTRRNGKSDAALYAVPAPRMMIEYRLGSAGFAADMARTSRSLLRLTERDFRRALRSPAAVVRGSLRNLQISRSKARLSARQLERVNAHLSAVFEELATSQGQREGRLHAFTIAIAPLEEGGA